MYWVVLDLVLVLVVLVLSDFSNQFKEMDKRICKIEESNEFLKAQYEKQRNTSDKCIPDNGNMREENAELKEVMKVLNHNIAVLERENNELEQYNRLDTLEFGRIAQVNGQDTEDVVLNIAGKVGVEI